MGTPCTNPWTLKQRRKGKTMRFIAERELNESYGMLQHNVYGKKHTLRIVQKLIKLGYWDDLTQKVKDFHEKHMNEDNGKKDGGKET